MIESSWCLCASVRCSILLSSMLKTGCSESTMDVERQNELTSIKGFKMTRFPNLIYFFWDARIC